MGKTIGAVVGGFVLWSVLWVGGTAVATSLMPEALASAERVEDVAVLLGLIAASVVVSVVSGYAAAAIAGRDHAVRAVQILAGVLLVVGIAVEASGWALTPVWYHLVFLALLVPATLMGGRLRSS